MGERPGTAHAAVLRSPHAHAEIVSLDATAALSMPEVVTVLTGEDAAAWSRPFIAGVKQPMRHYALAVDRVRYAGEPVAVVVARDRYAAEDALERIELEYRELDPVVDPVAAAATGAPLLHRDVGSNVVSDRHFRYGDPDTRVRKRRAPGGDLGVLSAQRMYADRGVRRGRRAPRGGRLRRPVQLPGSVHAASGDGAGAGGCGRAAAAAQPEGFRRKLRRQAGGLPVRRRDVPRLAQGAMSGQMGRGSVGASARRDLGDQPGHDA